MLPDVRVSLAGSIQPPESTATLAPGLRAGALVEEASQHHSIMGGPPTPGFPARGPARGAGGPYKPFRGKVLAVFPHLG